MLLPLTARTMIRLLLLAASLFLVLSLGDTALQELRRRETSERVRDETHAGNPGPLYRWLPKDLMHPLGSRIPSPHDLARRGDDALLGGHSLLALSQYQEACRAQPEDFYSRFLAACIRADREEWAPARAILDELLPRTFLLRSVHLLHHYVREREEAPGLAADHAYVLALADVAQDPRAAALPRIDLLYDLVERRVLHARPPLAPESLTLEERRLLDLAQDGDPAEARRLIAETAHPHEKLIGMRALFASSEPADRLLLQDELRMLMEWEPGNAYYEYLLAILASPDLLHSRQLQMDDEQEAPHLGTESIQHLWEAVQKPQFDPHHDPLFARFCELQRRSGDIFAELHVPPPTEYLFLGNPDFPYLLYFRALDPRSSTHAAGRESLIWSTLRLFREWPALLITTEGNEHIERARELVAGAGIEAAQRRELETQVQRLPGGYALPIAAEPLQRYIENPLPIPSLVRAFVGSYACDPGRLHRELRRLLGE